LLRESPLPSYIQHIKMRSMDRVSLMALLGGCAILAMVCLTQHETQEAVQEGVFKHSIRDGLLRDEMQVSARTKSHVPKQRQKKRQSKNTCLRPHQC
jgi:hypothetical protein